MREQKITDAIQSNYMPYVVHVIKERALPAIDGLKPSQRRILYTMFKMGLLNSGRKKSQGIVGQTMFLHPHGDATIYDTLVRMSVDNESLAMPYVNSKGNFGKVFSRDMQYASARYTEAKLTEIAKELFIDIDKNTVDMVDNYDGTLQEPTLLPISFPNVLINATSGTAVGMSSGFAPFNLAEVIDYTIAYLTTGGKAKVSDYIVAPDFPTGGKIVYNKETFENIFKTGRGTFKVRATYEIEDNVITFIDIPHTTTFEAIEDKIVDLVKEGKIKEITDINDILGKGTKGLAITVKNNANKEVLIEKLFKMTTLEDSFSCNFNLIINGNPKVLGIKEIISEWVKFRAETIKRGTQFDVDKKSHKIHMLLALKQVLLDIDTAISIIRNTQKNDDVVKALMKQFDIDEQQAEFVAEIKLKHLNKEYIINRTNEIKTLQGEVEKLNKVIEHKPTLAKLMIKQLTEIKNKHGIPRRSELIEINELPSIPKESITIDNYNIKVFVTKEGYLKKIPLTSLRGDFNIKVKDGDEIVNEYETTNASEILVFTNKQNVYKMKSYEIENHKPSVLGDYLPTVLELKDEEIMYVAVTNNYHEDLIIGYEDGKVARINLDSYSTKQNRSMLKNAYADKKALFFKMIIEDVDILAVSSIGKALLFNTSMINAKTSKTTIGNQIMKSKNDSYVKSYTLIEKDSTTTDIEYYRTLNAGVGKYLKKDDFNDLQM